MVGFKTKSILPQKKKKHYRENKKKSNFLKINFFFTNFTAQCSGNVVISCILFACIPAFTFFDPNDPACMEILTDSRTTIPELFAIIRQWVPQVQHKIDIIGNEVRDSLIKLHVFLWNCQLARQKTC